MSMPKDIVLVGGGVASIVAIETLRTEGYDGRIVLVSDETELPYDRPPLSKAYLSGETPLAGILLHDEAWYRDQRVELQLGSKVTGIDPVTAAVELASGTRLSYDRLLIAIGARARTLPAPMLEPSVPTHVIRTRADSDALRAALKPGLRVLLVGGGVIGMEAAATLTQQGCKVTVLETADRVMGRFFPPKLSEILLGVHRHRGVEVRLDLKIDNIVRSGAEVVVNLVGGERVVGDALIVGIGAVPRVELAAGLAQRLGGIEVDAQGQTSAPGVYAAGDVTSFPLPDGSFTRWENWTHARHQGAHAARHMLGRGTAYAELPWIWSDQYDLNLQVLGSPESDVPVVLRGSLEGGRLAAFHLRQGQLVGATLVNDGRHKAPIRKLIERGAHIAPEKLSDESVDLKKLAAAA
jgi:NADPH-dependent 2,4-dienoyl-CoA reductase/sulfur reductase-like enzyme